MATIIVGYFKEISALKAARRRLEKKGLTESDFANYFLNPPGAHGLYELGGDAYSDEGAADAGPSAAAGAAVGGTAGAAVGAVGGPVGALVGAGAGAYIGSLMGALKNLDDPDPEKASVEQPAEPPAGPVLAVRLDNPSQDTEYITIFEEEGAIRVDRTSGHWKNGQWTDFDPREEVFTVYRKDETVP